MNLIGKLNQKMSGQLSDPNKLDFSITGHLILLCKEQPSHLPACYHEIQMRANGIFFQTLLPQEPVILQKKTHNASIFGY